MKRHHRNGVRKVCGCPWRTWAKCEHPWHFAFKWQGVHHRLSLARHLGRHLDSKTAAEDAAADLRKAIKAGTFGQAAPREAMTLRQLADIYVERYVNVERADTAHAFIWELNLICRTVLPRPTGGSAALGDWRVADVVTDSIERFREVRRGQCTGVQAVNRNLARLRALFNWAMRVSYVEATPFKRHSEAVVKLSRELPRSRRLDAGEEQQLLAACGPHLRGVVETAIETGCRRGEILSLQWKQVEGMRIDGTTTIEWAPKAEFFLPAGKTKTKRDRRIPISTRLKAVLEMRRFDPAGQSLPGDGFVFGTEIGTRVQGFKRAVAGGLEGARCQAGLHRDGAAR